MASQPSTAPTAPPSTPTPGQPSAVVAVVKASASTSKDKQKSSSKVFKFNNPWQSITEEELAKHKDVDGGDAWIAIKGIVYDIAAYASKHPGGADPLKRHCGKDATDTFNMVHSYVMFEEILDGCRIGVLKGSRNAPKKSLCRDSELCCFGTRYKHPNTYFKQDSIVGTYIVMFHRSGHEYDWTVGVIDKQYLHVFKYIDKKKAWLSVYELPEPLLNDAISLDFKNNFENCEITLRKPLPATVWAKQTHGVKEAGQFVSVHRSHSKFEGWITTKKCLTHNILLFGVQLVPSARIGVPIGYHCDLFIGDLSRPYTPVCLSHEIQEPLVKHHHHTQQGPRDETSPCVLYFIIKIYPQGAFTQLLDTILLDDGSETPTLKVSTPHGYFPMNFLNDFTFMLLVAGGTGIAPMIKIIQYFSSQKERLRGKRVGFMYFCEKIYDIIWRKEFEGLQESVSWFYFFPVLTKPSQQCNWKGLQGRIDTEMVKECLTMISADRRGTHKACVCGPPGFNKASVNALSGHILSENIFVFD